MTDSLILPANVQLEYLNEGAANIVYKISIAPNTGLSPSEVGPSELDTKKNNSVFEKKLLRLRKDLPTSNPVGISQSHWTNLIAPLFNSNEIVQQSLVSVKPSGIIQRLNQELQDWEHSKYKTRPKNRHGVYLADEDYGLLVTNMTPIKDLNILVEFKPKWLVQSLCAPPNAVRCRQCAQNARVFAEFGILDIHTKTFCPLDLFSDNQNTIMKLARNLLPLDADEEYRRRLALWIQDFAPLHRLRELQIQLDQTGVLNANPSDENLLLAMTLRDCTIFVRISQDSENIEARIGDLDLKSASKIEHWKYTENRLINGGWYSGTEDRAQRQPNNCLLGRSKFVT
ncbi:hypothetical protein K3495_g7729 [Podosphaera aphanis]|nr:hypothetical protein K3495_g7729 [Podosphaera aphanis]